MFSFYWIQPVVFYVQTCNKLYTYQCCDVPVTEMAVERNSKRMSAFSQFRYASQLKSPWTPDIILKTNILFIMCIPSCIEMRVHNSRLRQKERMFLERWHISQTYRTDRHTFYSSYTITLYTMLYNITIILLLLGIVK